MKFKGKSLIDNLGEIITGKTPSTKNSEYWNGNIPFITPKDLQGSKHIISTERKITKLGAATVKGSIIPIHSVCVSCIGVIGYVGITTEESVSNQQINSIIVNENNDTDYVYYLMKWLWPYFKNYEGQSTTLSILNKTHFSKIEIPIHPLDYQRKVSKLLSMIDDKIELNQQINKNLEEQAQAIYKDMLCENDSKAVELQELCTFQEGYVNPPQGNTEYFDGEVKWLRAVDINESYIINTSRTLTQEGFDSAKKSALLFEPDTIAISKSGTIGRLGVIGDYMCGNRAVINIKPKQKEMLPFIYLYLKSRQREFAELAVGSVQKNLYVSLLEPLIVMIPKKDVLQSFCENADRQFEMIKRNCLENERLSQIRDALLPRLMSGEIDVSKIED